MCASSLSTGVKDCSFPDWETSRKSAAVNTAMQTSQRFLCLYVEQRFQWVLQEYYLIFNLILFAVSMWFSRLQGLPFTKHFQLFYLVFLKAEVKCLSYFDLGSSGD